MSQKSIPQATNMKDIRQMTEFPQNKLDEATLTMLKDRRKLIADYYYDKENPVESRQKFFDELSLLHDYFGFKKVWPVVKNNGNTLAKQTRSAEEKQSDIKSMHVFCWKLAVDEAKKIYPTKGRDQTILAEHFNKQYTHNWCS